MKNQYKLNISGIEVIFDMNTYSETNRIVDNIQQLIDIHNNEDYQLLYNFKMAKFAHDNNSPDNKYKEQYLELLCKVNERFPD